MSKGSYNTNRYDPRTEENLQKNDYTPSEKQSQVVSSGNVRQIAINSMYLLFI